MRILKIALITLVTSTAFIACKKEKNDNPDQSITGRWVGKYGFGNETPAHYFSLNFKSGGIIEELSSSGQVKGTGTWQMTGNTITAQYIWSNSNQSEFSIVASYYSSEGKLLGNWGYDDSATDGGLWEMTKQ